MKTTKMGYVTKINKLKPCYYLIDDLMCMSKPALKSLLATLKRKRNAQIPTK